jgi:hypothetical protein
VANNDGNNGDNNNRNSEHVEIEGKSDTGNNRGNWNNLKVTQTVPEQNTGKARN